MFHACRDRFMNIDEWFAGIREKYGAEMQCGKGCTACCHGLFDISLADAVEVARGFQELPPGVQERVRSQALDLQRTIVQAFPGTPQPALWDERDERIDGIVDAANNPPCPCLGDAGECLIYEHRPLACRLEGVPMIDTHDGLFGDWCELNFKAGVPEAAIADLQQDYDGIDQFQEARSAGVARRTGISDRRTVTFVPSVIADYEDFWRALLPPRDP
jgi:Fe-S-cluster containining protein